MGDGPLEERDEVAVCSSVKSSSEIRSQEGDSEADHDRKRQRVENDQSGRQRSVKSGELSVENIEEKIGDQLKRGSGSVTQLTVAFSEDKGSRPVMEDFSVMMLDAQLEQGLKNQRVSFFGVFDGHGGSNVAQYASENLHKAVTAKGLLSIEYGCVVGQEGGHFKKSASRSIVEGCKSLDEDILELSKERGWQDGSTAVGIWVVDEHVHVANVGDAKCVLARFSNKEGSKGQLKALMLTKEHLAIYPKERMRIEKAGGYVSNDGRLDGRLQVSRSFGDAQLKKSGLTALPDVQTFKITERDRFLICGCDGFWKVFDGQDAVNTANGFINDGRDAKWITNRMINMAVRERRCTDNCTVMLVRFGGSETGNGRSS